MRKSDLREFLHVMIHPNEGFAELSYYKRGSPLLAAIIVVSFFLVTLLERFGLAFRFNHYSVENCNVLLIFISTICLVCIGAIANWALSTLWDGKANLRMIWIVIGYAMAPHVMGMLLKTLLSHICTLEDATLLTIVTTACTLWSGLVLWFGMLQAQDYSIGKNLACLLGTVVGMLLILFLAFLVMLLFQQLGTFVYSLFDELVLRFGL